MARTLACGSRLNGVAIGSPRCDVRWINKKKPRGTPTELPRGHFPRYRPIPAEHANSSFLVRQDASARG
ncbi:MAG: hypothetical protein EA377_12310 [Phycisphaerales bacterium]|nr:MAG: hypothetical protein EA377_12310 [Phycisphaerales bacterium]